MCCPVSLLLSPASLPVRAADFRGKEIDSVIDGSKVRHFPSSTRQAYVLQSVVSVVSLIALVVGVVVSIYVIRYTIAGDVGTSNAQLVASIANALQIQVMNFIYSFVANALSERENHRWVAVLGIVTPRYETYHGFNIDVSFIFRTDTEVRGASHTPFLPPFCLFHCIFHNSLALTLLLLPSPSPSIARSSRTA